MTLISFRHLSVSGEQYALQLGQLRCGAIFAQSILLKFLQNASIQHARYSFERQSIDVKGAF
jgi:hypothetical protein